MRKKGCKTNAICWKLEVVNQNEIIFENEYSTLSEIAGDLGLTYNQVVELSSGRKKQAEGRFDTYYRFKKIKNNKKDIEKEEEEEDKEEDDFEDDLNPKLELELELEDY